jgi:Reverse transcriptase (RNA-dependent DNA polymerase)
MLLAYDAHKDFLLFQMNVKSFFNKFIDEEVYIQQPPDFLDPTLHNYVFRLIKALYELKISS